MEELKPCRTCGENPDLITEDDENWWGCGDPECCGTRPRYYYAQCKCGRWPDGYSYERNEDDFITAWNTRAADGEECLEDEN